MTKVNFFDSMLILMSIVVMVCLLGFNNSIDGFIISKAVAVMGSWIISVKYKQWRDADVLRLISGIKE